MVTTVIESNEPDKGFFSVFVLIFGLDRARDTIVVYLTRADGTNQ